MSYEAIVCRLCKVRKHTNADKLNIATCSGYQVIIGLDKKEGDLGILFKEGGQLTEHMCFVNNLFKKEDLNKDSKAPPGFFSENRRVKAIKLRGEISEGFWVPLDYISWAGNISTLKENDSFDSFNGHKICNKYYTPATIASLSSEKEIKKEKYNFSMLLEHYHTKQVRENVWRIPKESILYITSKCHGTSQRTGNINVVKNLSKFKNWWNKRFKFIQFNEDRWLTVSGTRRTIMRPKELINNIFHYKEDFRQQCHDKIKEGGLLKGETIYYEIVGFAGQKTIMPPHGIEDKGLLKKYGNKMIYKYGCEPGQNKIFVYRITNTNEDKKQIDLSWQQLVNRCKQLGLNHVPLLKGPLIYNGDKENLLEILKDLSDGPDPIDKSHIKEGVVLRIEHENLFENFKYKGFSFCMLEGIRANDDNFIDEEDVN